LLSFAWKANHYEQCFVADYESGPDLAAWNGASNALNVVQRSPTYLVGLSNAVDLTPPYKDQASRPKDQRVLVCITCLKIRPANEMKYPRAKVQGISDRLHSDIDRIPETGIVLLQEQLRPQLGGTQPQS
jgi:hypothetical protein